MPKRAWDIESQGRKTIHPSLSRHFSRAELAKVIYRLAEHDPCVNDLRMNRDHLGVLDSQSVLNVLVKPC